MPAICVVKSPCLSVSAIHRSHCLGIDRQPNDHLGPGSEDCIGMSRDWYYLQGISDKVYWLDVSCSSAGWYICERPGKMEH